MMLSPIMIESFQHLSDETKNIAFKDDDTRLAFIRSQHWLGYEIAIQLLNKFEDLINRPKKLRMPGILVVAETNNGKTTILNRFYSKHPPADKGRGIARHIPVVMIQAPPVADVRQFHRALITSLNSPLPSRCPADMERDILAETMFGVGAKVIIIDEFQHFISGSTNQHRTCLQTIKWIANELQIPIIAAGIKTAYSALRIDPQLENRFEITVLPRWEDGERLARMLKNVEAILPLKKQSGLELFTSQIANLIDGKLGELMNLMEMAASHAIKSGDDRIDLKTIRDCGWVSPHQRADQLSSLQ